MSELMEEEITITDNPMSQCRTCLCKLKENLKSQDIFEPWSDNEYDSTTIAAEMTKISNVEIADVERYPRYVCRKCLSRLKSAIALVKDINVTQEVLRVRLSNVKVDTDQTWPKPIQLDKNLSGEVLRNSTEVEIKEEMISDDERRDADVEMEDEQAQDNLSELDIKVEPEDMIEQPTIQVTVNAKMSESSSDTDEDLTPTTMNDLLPEKSRKKYEKCYEEFVEWKMKNGTTSFSEEVLLAYFQELSDKFKSSSLWTKYSMLKSILSIHEIDVTKYSKLIALLKRKSEGYKGKKSQTFSPGQIKKFLSEAPDQLYLSTKIALIFGIMGACRRQELYNLQFKDVQVFEATILVNIYNSKTKTNRCFSLTGCYYELCKQYIKLRPNPCSNPSFFLNFQAGKCTTQRIGINKFGNLGRVIANYLCLPNPELFTGHCFRRTSATLLVDSGGDIITLKRHGGLRSTTVAEGL